MSRNILAALAGRGAGLAEETSEGFQDVAGVIGAGACSIAGLESPIGAHIAYRGRCAVCATESARLAFSQSIFEVSDFAETGQVVGGKDSQI